MALNKQTETGLSLTLDQDDVMRIVNESIKTQVAVAMQANGARLIDELAISVLDSHVDDEGKPCRRDHYRAMSFLDYSLTRVLRNAVKEEVKTWVDENGEKIRELVARRLLKKGAPLADAMAKGMLDAMASQWRFSVKLSRDDDR